MEPCYYCGSILCDEECDETYMAQQEAIDRHVKNCKKDGFCEICQCM